MRQLTSWSITSNTERTIDDGQPREVTVRCVAGRVRITAGPEGSTAITVSTSDVRGPAVQVSDDGLNVRVEQFRGSDNGILGSLKGLLTGGTPISSTLTLTVPPATRVSVRTVSAPVQVHGTRATTSVDTATGAVTFAGIGAAAIVKTGGGDVTAEDVTGDLKATTVTGRITASGSTPVTIRTSTVSGATTLNVTGATLITARSVSADISVRTLPGQGYDVTAQSASGHIVIDGETLTGGDEGSRSGRKHDGARSLAMKARTMSGNIMLTRAGTTGPVLGTPGMGPVQDRLPGEGGI